jgi:hypothetical protein
VAGRPTTPAAVLGGVLPGPLMLPSAWRINKPIDPSFFFVVGIILNRMGTGLKRRW